MSMISAQIDELRQMADLYDALQKPAHVRVLRDAADTIWQLRDDLQRANSENAKLRELLTDGERHLLEILGKNKRLQELVRDYESCTMHADCGRCEYDGTTSTHCPLSPCFPDIDELRKLGVELDDD